MSEIKQINTGVAELLALKVPEGATRFFVHPFMSILGFTKEDGSSGFIEFDQPLTGPWELLGNYTELTEEQCREVVITNARGCFLTKSDAFDDYTNSDSFCDTAKEAFASLMQANACYSENPYKYGKPSIVNHDLWYSEEQWQQAEANTGTWLILRKI